MRPRAHAPSHRSARPRVVTSAVRASPPQTFASAMLRLGLGLAGAFVTAACSSAHGAVPALVVGGVLTRTQGAERASDAATQSREGWTARVDVSLAWLPAPPAAVPAPRPAPVVARPAPERPASAPCASARLCAWERTARNRTLQRLAPKEPPR